MRNGWTGGQYSLVRAGLGLTLAVRLGGALGGAPLPEKGLLLVGLLASVALVLGWRDRPAAVLAGLGLVLLARDGSHVPGPVLAVLGAVLLVHACLPSAPYGSLAAIGRADPGGAWRFPPRAFGLAWIALALGTASMGILHGIRPEGPERLAAIRPLVLAVELGFAPLALVRRARPLAWTALLALGLARIAAGDLTPAFVLALALTFDPAWIPARADRAAVRVFYDGACGLCQRSMRFLLAEDRGEALRFAPLEGETFRAEVGESASGLPDSLVVRLASGELLVRSRAVLALGEGLGGLWRVLAVVLRVVPRPLLDRAYDGIAAVRKRVFAPPPAACPLGPAHVARRFDP